MSCNKSSGCPKSGIKIHESSNDYRHNPFSQQQIQKTAATSQTRAIRTTTTTTTNSSSTTGAISPTAIDLNIDNYSIDDIFNLFKIQERTLTEDIMKQSKRIVLQTHPDKSKMDPKYFLFYSAAYKRLYSIYEFQNKSTKKTVQSKDYSNTEHSELLNSMFSRNEALKEPKNFNKWFNDQFEKHKTEDANENGYGDWLKSDEGIYDVGTVSKANMAQEFDKQKKQIQSLTVYNGVNDLYASTLGGTLLGQQENYTSDGGSYTDLRQAYVESVIPVTDDDYKNMPKYKNIEEYKMQRNNSNVAPLDKDTAMKQLFEQNKKEEQESAAIAYYYAQQTEKANKQNQSFWAGLKQLTNF
jgi:hypothetical protein